MRNMIAELDKTTIVGMVILHNSEPAVVDPIRIYIHKMYRLYVVDNSEHTDVELTRVLAE